MLLYASSLGFGFVSFWRALNALYFSQRSFWISSLFYANQSWLPWMAVPRCCRVVGETTSLKAIHCPSVVPLSSFVMLANLLLSFSENCSAILRLLSRRRSFFCNCLLLRPSWWLDARSELRYDVTMVGTAVSSTHGSWYSYIWSVLYPGDDVVNEMPVLQARIHPGRLFRSW